MAGLALVRRPQPPVMVRMFPPMAIATPMGVGVENHGPRIPQSPANKREWRSPPILENNSVCTLLKKDLVKDVFVLVMWSRNWQNRMKEQGTAEKFLEKNRTIFEQIGCCEDLEFWFEFFWFIFKQADLEVI